MSVRRAPFLPPKKSIRCQMNFKGAAVVSIVGKQNVGKTTLIKSLIPKLKKSGYRVGTFKYNIRKLEIDHKNKDTYKYFQSGAETVAISSHDQIAVMRRTEVLPKIGEILEKYFYDVNIVLLEGYRGEEIPEIEILDSLEFEKIKKDENKNGLSLSMEGTKIGSFSDRDINNAFLFLKNIISCKKYNSKKYLQNA
ncbi:MAG: molybdopterin-guanine dinucleotide biosynthesis protein B [Candidatus Scalindua sp. AMX11]|nr:MAG: molybdopterin-guanine dinucleotide biosynthesis protein B [Candidatus Scalindua sp.]TDE66090.1 MAG: molybdopterin-guanine dinucleotide biosynthesis protein B [Candidatus Scalindua sp. AMX11]